jgi:hypothetical protein
MIVGILLGVLFISILLLLVFVISASVIGCIIIMKESKNEIYFPFKNTKK